jgi:hypothetical protein
MLQAADDCKYGCALVSVQRLGAGFCGYTDRSIGATSAHASAGDGVGSGGPGVGETGGGVGTGAGAGVGVAGAGVGGVGTGVQNEFLQTNNYPRARCALTTLINTERE